MSTAGPAVRTFQPGTHPLRRFYLVILVGSNSASPEPSLFVYHYLALLETVLQLLMVKSIEASYEAQHIHHWTLLMEGRLRAGVN